VLVEGARKRWSVRDAAALVEERDGLRLDRVGVGEVLVELLVEVVASHGGERRLDRAVERRLQPPGQPCLLLADAPRHVGGGPVAGVAGDPLEKLAGGALEVCSYE
jgi:hypothetical protein